MDADHSREALKAAPQVVKMVTQPPPKPHSSKPPLPLAKHVVCVTTDFCSGWLFHAEEQAFVFNEISFWQVMALLGSALPEAGISLLPQVFLLPLFPQKHKKAMTGCGLDIFLVGSRHGWTILGQPKSFAKTSTSHGFVTLVSISLHISPVVDQGVLEPA